MFERLSVFASGWAITEAKGLCACNSMASEHFLQALPQLVRRSLVTKLDSRHRRARLGPLETRRQYALDRLVYRDGEPITSRERHRLATQRWCSGWIRLPEPALLTCSGSNETLMAPIFDILSDAHDNRAGRVEVLARRLPTNRWPVLVRAFGARPIRRTVGT